jgi:hypothetical protein
MSNVAKLFPRAKKVTVVLWYGDNKFNEASLLGQAYTALDFDVEVEQGEYSDVLKVSLRSPDMVDEAYVKVQK